MMSDGWWPNAARKPSPNADERPVGERILLVVLHHISLPAGTFTGDAIERLFLNTLDPQDWPRHAALRVSAHFLIRRGGQTTQFVDIWRRAWHAGVSCWRGRERCNDFSVGIELEGDAPTPFTDAQYDTLNALLGWLHQATGVRSLSTHSEIAAGRKIDPGPCFDFSRLLPPPGETLEEAAIGVKRKTHGAQRPRHNSELGEGASTVQRSDSPTQPVIQRFPASSAYPPPDTVQCDRWHI